MNYARLSFFAVMLISFFFVPWWMVYVAVIVYSVYYTPTFEIIALGLLTDMLYGSLYVHTISISLWSIVVYAVRSRVRL